ncbi:MAG TPA: TetR/AcrR family transcriptional regulator [Cellulomonas sp.]|uniref:TetR/AcrR family transcriptional regulator n=1 Tax=Cellulomonas sp. TaxID=40001 RepID=UPI002E331E89|nr:TetR/AcrR family transcriptional regulator [Cellulomonas sp.]HEX5331889.1 TetR/AcrR family transcriptional regulator [Cellulomonas sp.]
MPRIDAPTVAEHHVMRRDAIIAAARDLLGSAGASAVTPAAVAGRSGLARTSVYQYFPSTGALLAAAVEATFADSSAALAAGIEQAGDPRSRIHAYVCDALRLAARDHGPFHQLTLSDLPPECVARVRELHDELVAPLRSAIEDFGVRDTTLVTGLVFGAISAAVQLVDHGRDLDETTTATLSFIDAGLDAAR